MSRGTWIKRLIEISPLITNVTVTMDMGYEFSAIVPKGVIYPYPGMLLSYSDGRWPPDAWAGRSEAETNELMKGFLLDQEWDVTPWEDIDDDEIEALYGHVSDGI